MEFKHSNAWNWNVWLRWIEMSGIEMSRNFDCAVSIDSNSYLKNLVASIYVLCLLAKTLD